jgi:hypothetical protein
MTRPLSRRTLLRGAGAALALPALQAMRPRRAVAGPTPDATAPVARAAFIFFPNGAVPDAWRCEGEGSGFRLGRTLAPLEPFREHLTVIDGTEQRWGEVDGAGDHARSAATFLTGARANKSETELRLGQSIDQFLADRIGRLTRFPSLELGIHPGRNAGRCDSGYSCAYTNTISWRSATQPMPKETNPRAVFERLFSTGSRQRTAERLATRKSVLDIVSAEAAGLRAKLGREDRRKVDDYLGSVREIERRIERLDEFEQVEPPEIDLPDRPPQDYGEHVRLMYELMRLAFQTDSTRIATFMLDAAASNRSYPNLEVNDGHHYLSHHRNDPEKLAKLAKIDRLFAEQFAWFLQRLAETPDGATADGERSLLDNSLLVYGSGISDGDRHNHDELPIVVAGNGAGRWEAHQRRRYPHGTPLNNLFLNLCDAVGTDGVRSFGDSTGRLPGLLRS